MEPEEETEPSCTRCDGWGIMTLWMGLKQIPAPCLDCSPDGNLTDLMRRKNDAIVCAEEKRRIAAHNARMAELHAPRAG